MGADVVVQDGEWPLVAGHLQAGVSNADNAVA